MFGAGGGTSAYKEIEETDLIILWGSNARETHPIFFHHLLKGRRRGAAVRDRSPADLVGRVGGCVAWPRRGFGQSSSNEIACAQLCGLGHYRMRGFVTVQTAEDFQKWMEEKLKEQSAPDPFR